MKKLEQQHISLREEYIKLSKERHEWVADKETLKQLQESHSDLVEKYETLLTMYGEKAEEVDELRLDLSDVNVIYKAQVQFNRPFTNNSVGHYM